MFPSTKAIFVSLYSKIMQMLMQIFNFSLEKLLLREMVTMKELDQLDLEVHFAR